MIARLEGLTDTVPTYRGERGGKEKAMWASRGSHGGGYGTTLDRGKAVEQLGYGTYLARQAGGGQAQPAVLGRWAKERVSNSGREPSNCIAAASRSTAEAKTPSELQLLHSAEASNAATPSSLAMFTRPCLAAERAVSSERSASRSACE
ncbi:uncharacterized protein PAN0_003c1884 [Moesziomyces antarcticus]|uniref:uncharacterized protein n=1 Tax=Pseudozyma antarctica TaxID=84753 RepID=UPI0007197E48|nr:uncharacterized protein PAN0_003c1884 [Moesziomyces antarcticus]GAK63677.1 hypothetical protein PAN0_003c1884 [Moesziomyces antarcticus]